MSDELCVECGKIPEKCRCPVPPPAGAADAEAAANLKMCNWLLHTTSDGAFPMELPKLRNLARAHLALIADAAHWKSEAENVLKLAKEDNAVRIAEEEAEEERRNNGQFGVGA